jgi:hypothetical protein
MKKVLTLALTALLATATLQSCANDPEPSTNSNQITFTQGANATFTYHKLDTTAGRMNQPMEEGKDSANERTIVTNHSFDGKTGVTMKELHYLGENEKDTSYLWQASNGDLYIHNFGLELVNSVEAQAVLNQPISASWVLTAKMAAATNATWTAVDTNVSLINLGITAAVKDVVTANGNETVTINGQQVSVKKFTHVVTATLPIFGQVAKTEIEIYVSAAHGGIVRQVRKVATYTLPGQPQQLATGADLNIVTYTK